MDYQKLSISISGGDQEIVVTTLLIQGNYPNYDREEIIPTSYAGYITVDRQELLQKLPQIMALTTAYLNYPVKLSVEDEKLTLSSGKTDNGELNATLSCHCLGEVASLSINGRFLLDFLKKCSFPQIEIAIINSNRPVRITGMNDNNVEYIVRPLVVD
jgi:DNA polymerase III, beta subunit|nr:MAG TPA: beta clamp protein [Caudoviricetes sp.]